MRKGNQRLPAWLAGITVLAAAAGAAGAQEPGATSDTAAAAITGIKDCTSASGAAAGRCDETQSGQSADDESAAAPIAQTARDEDAQTQAAQRAGDEPSMTSKGFDEAPRQSVADESAARESRAGSGELAGNSPDETPQTRVVPPAYATPAPPSMTDAAATASTSAAGQGSVDTATGAGGNDTDSSREQNGAIQGVAQAHESSGNEGGAASSADPYAGKGEERDAIGAGASAGIAGAGSQFAALDTDHDGTIDAAEASVSTTLRAQFFTLDADGDGKLSMAEFRTASDIASIRADRREQRQ